MRGLLFVTCLVSAHADTGRYIVPPDGNPVALFQKRIGVSADVEHQASQKSRAKDKWPEWLHNLVTPKDDARDKRKAARQARKAVRQARKAARQAKRTNHKGKQQASPPPTMLSRAEETMPAAQGDDADGRRPNILFLQTDSMDGRVLDPEAAESRIVDLPFLRDTLAPRGALFQRTYTNIPICVPSRSSMMSGRSPEKIFVWGNDRGLAATPDGMLDESCVKHYGKARCRRFAEAQGYPTTILSTLVQMNYNVMAEGRLDVGAGFTNKEHRNTEHPDPRIPGSQSQISFGPPLPSDFYRLADIRVTGENRTVTDRVVIVESGEKAIAYGPVDRQTREHCIDWIRSLPDPADAENPFFLYCSFSLPHYMFEAQRGWFDSVPENQVTMPEWKEGFPDAWHGADVYKTFADGVIADYDPAMILKMRRAYFAMCLQADSNMGLVYEALIQKGYSLEDTYIIYTSDHGEMAYEHRQWGKESLYEGSVRVPMIIAGPGIQQGARLPHLTSLLDVVPTLLDMAQVSNPDAYKRLHGRSILGAVSDASVAPEGKRFGRIDDRDFVLSQYNWAKANCGQYMVRSGQWKLIIYGHTFLATRDYQPQLFDLENDPKELHNVADAHPDVVGQLQDRLREHGFHYEEVDLMAANNTFQQVLSRVDKDTFLTQVRKNNEFGLEDEVIEAAKQQLDQIKSFAPYWFIEDDAPQKFFNWFLEARDLFGTN